MLLQHESVYQGDPPPERAPAVPLTPLPALDLTRELYAAVVRSHDDDCSATEALEKLQNRVLLACARFECSTVIL